MRGGALTETGRSRHRHAGSSSSSSSESDSDSGRKRRKRRVELAAKRHVRSPEKKVSLEPKSKAAPFGGLPPPPPMPASSSKDCPRDPFKPPSMKVAPGTWTPKK